MISYLVVRRRVFLRPFEEVHATVGRTSTANCLRGSVLGRIGSNGVGSVMEEATDW